MNERVLTIVNILAKYILGDKPKLSETEIVEELLEVGFATEEIEAAFDWMENSALPSGGSLPGALPNPTHRVFTAEEEAQISSEARGFLIRLRAAGILDDETQEEIIDRALQASQGDVNLDSVKSVTALILFAKTQSHGQRAVDCLIKEDWPRLLN